MNPFLLKMKKGQIVVLLHLILVLSICKVFSQDTEKEQLDVELYSPYHSIVNHLKYLQKDNYHPDLSAKSLQFKKGVSLTEQKLLTNKLK